MKILIVEDDFIIALDLKRTLAQLNYEVIGVAECYEEAIGLVKAKHPELILMDISIDGPKDGISLAEELQKEYGICSIFITALTDSETLRRAKALNPCGYVVKPFTVGSIKAAITLSNQQQTIQDEVYEKTVADSDYKKPSLSDVPEKIRSSVDYIEKKFNRELPISEVADYVKLNVNYFSSRFKEVMGVSPQQFIIQKRLDEAKYLLKNTSLSIHNVSVMVGYTNPAHFSASFKRHIGASPYTYQQR